MKRNRINRRGFLRLSASATLGVASAACAKTPAPATTEKAPVDCVIIGIIDTIFADTREVYRKSGRSGAAAKKRS